MRLYHITKMSIIHSTHEVSYYFLGGFFFSDLTVKDRLVRNSNDIVRVRGAQYAARVRGHVKRREVRVEERSACGGEKWANAVSCL